MRSATSAFGSRSMTSVPDTRRSGYLRRFRVDILKIAKEFIGPADGAEEWAFAGAIVALGRTLGLAIIAEGIETPGQLERLRGLGCEFGQGYLFARPVDADAIERFLAEGGARRPIPTQADPFPTSEPTVQGRPYAIGHAQP